MILAATTTIHISITAADWGAVLPELIMGGGALLMLLLDVFLAPENKLSVTTGVALAIIAAAFIASYQLWSSGTASAMYGTVASDQFAMFFNYVILVAAALAVLLSPSYIRTSAFDPGEYYALVLAATAGMMLMAAGTNLMVLFIALELLSLSLYILSGFERFRAFLRDLWAANGSTGTGAGEFCQP